MGMDFHNCVWTPFFLYQQYEFLKAVAVNFPLLEQTQGQRQGECGKYTMFPQIAQGNRIKMQQINNQHRFALGRRHPLMHYTLQIKQLIIENNFDAVALANSLALCQAGKKSPATESLPWRDFPNRHFSRNRYQAACP